MNMYNSIIKEGDVNEDTTRVQETVRELLLTDWVTDVLGDVVLHGYFHAGP